MVAGTAAGAATGQFSRFKHQIALLSNFSGLLLLFKT
jgi:hypothetical protein